MMPPAIAVFGTPSGPERIKVPEPETEARHDWIDLRDPALGDLAGDLLLAFLILSVVAFYIGGFWRGS